MKRMPALFVGHGSPMNAIEDNSFSAYWETLGRTLPRPKAILAVSAHWFTRGTKILNALHPETIHDMYGFPYELYQLRYPALGAVSQANRAKQLLGNEAEVDNSWGFDHGTWSVLHRMYPEADIPLFQISVNASADAQAHFQLGQRLSALRDEGVMILGSGNIVHNLIRVNWTMPGGYPWAEAFDAYVKESILSRSFEQVINYKRAGDCALTAFTALDHFAPLLCILGASDEADRLSVFNNACVMGSLSMTGYLFE